MSSVQQGKLAGRRIVVTGAASGIGRAVARLFAEEGATPILMDLHATGLDDVIGDGPGLGFAVDVSDETAVEAAISEAAAKLGGIDGVVNCAGIMRTGATGDFSFADWHKTIGVNLTGTFNVVKCALPWLKAEKGSTIVNIASGVGILPNAPGVVAYAASKGGVISMTRALAADLAPDIRVNCLCPGLVNTPLAGDFINNTAAYALKRAAEPVEIARSVLFLSSEDSSYVTGATLAADGGRTFH